MAKIEWVATDGGEKHFVFPSWAGDNRTCMAFPDGWWLHDAPNYDESGQVAGPFPDLESCKAAYLLMWGGDVMAKVEWRYDGLPGAARGKPFTHPSGARKNHACMGFEDGWYLHDQKGFDESGQVAGPFPNLDACKAAYLLMWGSNT